MRILVVGAGALGQPFGYHLQESGADVAYSIKPRHRDDCEGGFTLHEYRMFGGPERHEFADYELFEDYDALDVDTWDQVWLCVSSPAVRGDWLPELLDAVGDTTLVSIQPGLDVREHLESLYPADRIVSIRVSTIAWKTPLPGEELPAGDIAYFLPPGEPNLAGGAMERAEDVVSVLREGGCPAEVDEDVLTAGAYGAAVLEPAVAALETADWSLRDFRDGEALPLASRAASEALRVVADKYGESPPWTMRMATRPWVMRLGVPFLSWVMPFDLEAYLEEHFTKVGDQTREELADYIELGDEGGLEVDGLRELLRGLPE